MGAADVADGGGLVDGCGSENRKQKCERIEGEKC